MSASEYHVIWNHLTNFVSTLEQLSMLLTSGKSVCENKEIMRDFDRVNESLKNVVSVSKHIKGHYR